MSLKLLPYNTVTQLLETVVELLAYAARTACSFPKYPRVFLLLFRYPERGVSLIVFGVRPSRNTNDALFKFLIVLLVTLGLYLNRSTRREHAFYSNS